VIALGALNAAFVQGIRIPHELTLVGFGDIPMSSWPMLDLTTMEIDLGEMADVAAGLLVSQIADPSRPPQSVVLPASMVLRSTHEVPFGGGRGSWGSPAKRMTWPTGDRSYDCSGGQILQWRAPG